MIGLPFQVDQNLILTGYSGPGQVALARQIAERLQLRLVDFPTRFEQHAGCSAETLQAQFGEARVKAVEAEMVEEIALHRGALINISGETLLHSTHFNTLNSTGVMICLTASLDAILQRLHLAMGARFHDPREREIELAHLRREWAIRERGAYEIDTSALNEDEIVQAVINHWRGISGKIDWQAMPTVLEN